MSLWNANDQWQLDTARCKLKQLERYKKNLQQNATREERAKVVEEKKKNHILLVNAKVADIDARMAKMAPDDPRRAALAAKRVYLTETQYTPSNVYVPAKKEFSAPDFLRAGENLDDQIKELQNKIKSLLEDYELYLEAKNVRGTE